MGNRTARHLSEWVAVEGKLVIVSELISSGILESVIFSMGAAKNLRIH